MYIGLQVKYPFLLSYFNETWLLDKFSKNTEISNFMKIRPVGAELFHADRRTDMTKLMVAFRDFTNALTNEKSQGCPCAHHKGMYQAQGYSSIRS
jgi:hypothetical protein